MAGKPRSHEYFSCPHCGAKVPVGAAFCRECGASDESGWSQEDWQGGETTAGYAPDDDFDYDEFLHREFPEQAPPRQRKQQAKRLVVVLLVLATVAVLLATTLIGY
jgi:hypothetical protein